MFQTPGYFCNKSRELRNLSYFAFIKGNLKVMLLYAILEFETLGKINIWTKLKQSKLKRKGLGEIVFARLFQGYAESSFLVQVSFWQWNVYILSSNC